MDDLAGFDGHPPNELYSAAVALREGHVGSDGAGGYKSRAKKRPDLALVLFEKIATMGLEGVKMHPQCFLFSIYNAAVQYRDGHGVERDYAEALKWFRIGAEQGDPDAMNEAATMLDQGQGCEVDHASAAKLFQKSADLGSAGGQLHLGNLYKSGRVDGFAQDLNRAVELYRLAAGQDHANFSGPAFNNLADCYKKGGTGNIVGRVNAIIVPLTTTKPSTATRHLSVGLGVERDLDKSIELYLKAVQVALRFVHSFCLKSTFGTYPFPQGGFVASSHSAQITNLPARMGRKPPDSRHGLFGPADISYREPLPITLSLGDRGYAG